MSKPIIYKRCEMFGSMMILGHTKNDNYNVVCSSCNEEFITTVDQLRWYKCPKCKIQSNYFPDFGGRKVAGRGQIQNEREQGLDPIKTKYAMVKTKEEINNIFANSGFRIVENPEGKEE